jgi:hypothetical protein
MAELIPSISDSNKSRVGTFWGSSPLINGGQTPKTILCNSLPKIPSIKDVNKSETKTSSSLLNKRDEALHSSKIIQKSASSSAIFNMTAVMTDRVVNNSSRSRSSANIHAISSKRKKRSRRGRQGYKIMDVKSRQLSMVAESTEHNGEEETDSDADSWFSDLSSEDEEIIYTTSHPEEEEEDRKTKKVITHDLDTKFIGTKAKETFYQCIATNTANNMKLHLPSTKRYNWSSIKIKKCTGIMNLPPITPRSQFINNCDRANYVPEPILIRREQNSSSLSLQHLGLSQGKFNVLLNSLPTLKNIQTLNLRGNSLTRRSIENLLQTLQPMDSCKSIDLSYNTIGSNAMKLLANYVSKGTLTTISVTNCRLTNGCIEGFCDELMKNNKKNINLTSIDMQRNEIGNGSKVIESCPKLLDLNLSFNKIKTEDGIEIAKLLQNSSKPLQRLSLYLCPLIRPYSPTPDWWKKQKRVVKTEDGEEILVEVEEEPTITVIDELENIFFDEFAAMISNNTKLEDIDISNTGFWKVSCLCDAITNNRNLRHFSLANNSIPKLEMEPFSEAMKSNHTIEGIHIMIGNAVSVDSLGFLRPLNQP